jgi:RHS repeat-associated protein
LSLQRQTNFSALCESVPIRNIADYSPFGVQLDGRTIQGDFYRRGFNGMEKDDEVKGGGNSYDFGARMYDARVGRWLTIDPLLRKYPSLSPYNFVSNNPLIFVDPNGKEIKPADNNTLEVIKSTLPKDARDFVVINPETGFIDKTALMKYENKGGSGNFSAFLSLVTNDEVVQVSLTTGSYELKPSVINGTEYPFFEEFGDIRLLSPDEKINGMNGDPDYNLSTDETGNLGGNIPKDQSKSGNLEVVVNSKLSKAGQVEVMAHELFGHALLNLNKKDSKHEINKETKSDQNFQLKEQIIKSVNEAKSNYENE